MADLAFHTFLILFFCGLVGMVLGWSCRAIVEKFNTSSKNRTVIRNSAKRAQSKKLTSPVKNTAAKSKGKPRRKTRSVKKDNLKLISGVGPVLEKKLNKQGISTFAQIALWKNSDIDKFDEVLDFKGRISREGWVKQAKYLVKKNP